MIPPQSLAALLLGLSASSCCVAPPRSDDWLAVGWRSPSQAFASFQTAIRADSAELEYRSFSTGFRERHRISKMVWREARLKLREEYPWLRKGIADARFTSPPQVVGAHARAEVESHGTKIMVEFVREDFAQLWEGDTLVSDELVPFTDATRVDTAGDGERSFHGFVVLPSGDESGSSITELVIGREWKIDSFEAIEATTGSASSRAEAPHPEKSLD